MPTERLPLQEFRIQAARLLKALRNSDAMAAERFRRISPFREKSVNDILNGREAVRLKHALEVVAREAGKPSWKHLKDSYDDLWYGRYGGGFLNHWFSTYADAKAQLDECGGYLLTDHGKYFVCERGFIETIGLDPDDPRWEAIGFDCARPRDDQAYQELVAMRQKCRAVVLQPGCKEST